MGDNCKPQSPARRSFNGLPGPLGQGEHADSFSVARVRPRTSKGITDLLLLNLVRLETAGPSKKNFNTSPVSCATANGRAHLNDDAYLAG